VTVSRRARRCCLRRRLAAWRLCSGAVPGSLERCSAARSARIVRWTICQHARIFQFFAIRPNPSFALGVAQLAPSSRPADLCIGSKSSRRLPTLQSTRRARRCCSFIAWTRNSPTASSWYHALTGHVEKRSEGLRAFLELHMSHSIDDGTPAIPSSRRTAVHFSSAPIP